VYRHVRDGARAERNERLMLISPMSLTSAIVQHGLRPLSIPPRSYPHTTLLAPGFWLLAPRTS
jgi:hypothetical protein